MICAVLPLIGCMTDGQRPVGDGTLTGFISEVAKPGSIQEARNRTDDAKCREYGFRPGTGPYGNCRIQMEQIRSREDTVERNRQRDRDDSLGNKVYSGSECVGPVIMGRCDGSTIPNAAYHPTCHGDWLNGHCTGPIF
jgi:hypothetical protein